MSLRNKNNHHIKGVYKTNCYKTKSKFFQSFFSHWLLRKCFFFFLIKAFANFEKLIRFYWQAFIVYKNGENFKTLIENFAKNLWFLTLFWPFQTIWNPKFSSLANHGDWHRALLLFEISGCAPVMVSLTYHPVDHTLINLSYLAFSNILILFAVKLSVTLFHFPLKTFLFLLIIILVLYLTYFI